MTPIPVCRGRHPVQERLTALLVLAVLGLACASATNPPPRRTPAAESGTPSPAPQEVLAVIESLDPKSYTDHLEDGSVLLVSDVFVLSVVEPHELAGLIVNAYYQGTPELGGRTLRVGDFLRFELPPEPVRHGVLLWDLDGLRLAEPQRNAPQ